MLIHPAKLEWDYKHVICEIEESLNSFLDELPCGIFKVYRDNNEPEAFLVTTERQLAILKRKMETWVLVKIPHVRQFLEGILAHANKHPSSTGEYCFVCSSY